MLRPAMMMYRGQIMFPTIVVYECWWQTAACEEARTTMGRPAPEGLATDEDLHNSGLEAAVR